MNWRAAGAQFYPGGAHDALREAHDRAASHRGRGPKNFVRSDARLHELICERLTDDDYIDARDISVEVSNGEVTLQGTVPMHPQKSAVEDLVAGIAGVSEVHNQLSVSDTLDYPPPNNGLAEG
jgi:osmotically-inducible protein OsmY